jgi:hypothetical protein
MNRQQGPFMTTISQVSDYNREQWASLHALRTALLGLSESELQTLRTTSEKYLQFREDLDCFQLRVFGPQCKNVCYDTGLSACCGFESIFTFFADHVINCLYSTMEDIEGLLCLIEKPNLTSRCVYLGKTGCLWKIRPISCAMFVCEDAKKSAFLKDPSSESAWMQFTAMEKEFSLPIKPVLFDDLESQFMRLGLQSPHMYYHQSPGLIRVKKKAGLI